MVISWVGGAGWWHTGLALAAAPGGRASHEGQSTRAAYF